MTATPHDAKNEYSRGSWRPRRPGRVPTAAAERAAQGLMGAGAVGVLLIAWAEFATLYSVHTPTSLRPIQTVTAGAHNAYALLQVALLAGLLVAAAWRQGRREGTMTVCTSSALPNWNRMRSQSFAPTAWFTALRKASVTLFASGLCAQLPPSATLARARPPAPMLFT